MFSSPTLRAQDNAQTIADLQSLAGISSPKVQVMEALKNRDWGSLEGKNASEVGPSIIILLRLKSKHLAALWCCTDPAKSL